MTGKLQTLQRVIEIEGLEVDKGVGFHDYLRHYEPLLLPWRTYRKPFALLEIGTFRGQSLLMWHAWFPKAHIVGVDVAPEVEINISRPGSVQTVVSDFHDYTPGAPFHCIIDDGSHQPQDVVDALDRFWPHLHPGGYYCIEDWHVIPWDSSAGELLQRINQGLIAGGYQDVDRLMVSHQLVILQKQREEEQ